MEDKRRLATHPLSRRDASPESRAPAPLLSSTPLSVVCLAQPRRHWTNSALVLAGSVNNPQRVGSSSSSTSLQDGDLGGCVTSPPASRRSHLVNATAARTNTQAGGGASLRRLKRKPFVSRAGVLTSSHRAALRGHQRG